MYASRFFILLSFLVILTDTFGQTGVKGHITTEQGEALAFATIFVKQTGTGTTANAEGFYEIHLQPGRHDLVFQHLGRKTAVRVIEITSSMQVLDVQLAEEEIMLKEITIGGDNEDPAYTIMRKTIAKADYHRNVVDHYSAKVYIKGSGKLKDYPWLAKKALEKDGVEKGRVYLSESLSEIKFTRPNKFEQKVISVRSDRKENASPGSYIFGSFYEPEVAGTISPLSPKAFSYYRFEYLGTFQDRDFQVSRIKVIPRSKGEDVVEGVIAIVEDWWSIHSLDLSTSKLGVTFDFKVTFAPIDEKVWLPVSHQFNVDDKVMGFEFEAHYLSSVSDYKIKINPKIYVENMEVIDEKQEKALAKQVEKKQAAISKAEKKKGDTRDLHERLASGEEITRKELKSLIKDFEKEDRKQQEEPDVVSDFNFQFDTVSFKTDSTYWNAIRPIPLTKEEIIGYEKADSASAIEVAREKGDTLKASKHKGFQPWDLVTGDHYSIGKHSTFRIYFPMPGFNTVEGLNLVYKIAAGTVLQDTNKTRLRITPVARYSFERKKFSGYTNLMAGNNKWRADFDIGRYIEQFNNDRPILPVVNTLTTLLLEKNLMKIYEHDFASLKVKRNINAKWVINTSWLLDDRMPLSNNSDFKLINRDRIEGYTPNEPANVEVDSTTFKKHRGFTGSIGITATPWLKYRSHNGQKYAIPGSSPVFNLEYKKGFNNIFGSNVNYDLLEGGIKYGIGIFARGVLDFNVQGGVFLNRNKMYFMDFKHFIGNQTPILTTDPVESFRLLDYYKFSTSRRYLTASANYQFRRFLLTTIPQVRLAGIHENIIVNYLKTPDSKNYTELGYSIDGILRVFRLEAVTSFENGKFMDYGFRIGVASNITVNFSD